MKLAGTLLAGVALAMGGSQEAAAPTTLPPPSFRAPGGLLAFVGAGARVALSTGCDVRVADLLRGRPPVLVRRFGDCRSDPGDSAVDDLHMGSTILAEQVILSPSPHSERYTLATGRLSAGPLARRGGHWGWNDSAVPPVFGCAWSVVAGGGTVASAQVPNRTGVDRGVANRPSCPNRGTTRVSLARGSPAAFGASGSWDLLATDADRVVLAGLDAEGLRTGLSAVFSATGKLLRTPTVAPETIKAAYDGWLTARGIVLRERGRIVGPGWTISGLAAFPEAGVALGRLFYLRGRVIRVRRLRDLRDRPLLVLPRTGAFLAPGSYGLAVAFTSTASTSLHRIPWRTIDRVLPR